MNNTFGKTNAVLLNLCNMYFNGGTGLEMRHAGRFRKESGKRARLDKKNITMIVSNCFYSLALQKSLSFSLILQVKGITHCSRDVVVHGKRIVREF
jgi:hypothetical protein